jgi:hypothetical protein
VTQFPSSCKRKHKSIYLILLALAFWLALSGCRQANPLPTANPGEPTATLPAVEQATQTLAPTPTMQVAQVILLALEGADPGEALAIQNVLSELAAQEKLTFETRTDLTGIEFGAGVRLVVAVAPDPGIANLAAANPQVQFLAVNIPGVQAASNLSAVGSAGDRPDQQGFLAGYLAAVITQDWRVGVISKGDTVEGKAARLGFSNGVIFYCGLCRPAYPPFVQYPQYVELAAEASAAEQQAAADILIQNAVKTVYVFPGAGDQTLLEYLAQAGVYLIGGALPGESLRASWITSIRVDEAGAIRQIWPRLMSGENAINLSAPLVMSDQNSALFSLGRQHLVEKMLVELLAGYIDTGVNLQTGEAR